MKPFSIAGIQMRVSASYSNVEAMKLKLDILMNIYPWVDMVVFSELCAYGPLTHNAQEVPGAFEQEMCAAALSGDIARARAANNRLLGLHTKLFVEGNPIPVKWALAQMGLIEAGIRLPLVPLSANFHETVREAMRQAGIQAKNGPRSVEGKAI